MRISDWSSDVCSSDLLRLADGSLRTIHPAHIVMATSQIGTPNVPTIPTLERFSGQVMHSSRFKRGSEWADRNVLVLGTDRKRVVEGKSVSVSVDLGGRSIIKTKHTDHYPHLHQPIHATLDVTSSSYTSSIQPNPTITI